MVRKKKEEREEDVGGRDPADPMGGGKIKDRDKWWRLKDKNFRRWYHKRKKKDRGYRNVDTEEEMEEYYREWIGLNKPEV